MSIDAIHMARAIRLGERALGTTAENPPVGCVIARGETVLGIGWTQAGGRPHAETEALAMADEAARGATAYVTLEPCAHHGRTPPCAEALVKAGIARCVIAVVDPDPRVNGGGIAKLKAAGIGVTVGPGETEARAALQGFLTRSIDKRPQVILKLAVSVDGMMAARAGEETVITGPEVKARVHLMRAMADAILVGRGTLETDDPELTVRLPGLESRSPRRLVATGKDIPVAAKVQPAAVFVTGEGLAAALGKLAGEGINTLLVEGGAALARSFLEARLVDRLCLFRATGKVLGSEGVKAPLDAVAPAGLHLSHEERLGNDRLSVYERR